MTPQYRIEQYLAAINAAYMGESPLPEYPAEPVWRIEGFLAAILSAAKGDSPVMACPDPVWHIEEFARAIYDALVGASPAWPCPTATNNIETILLAIYNVVADGTETDDIMTSWDIEKWLMGSYEAAKEGGDTKATVVGVAPITLSDAISAAIISLTRYGLCTQDGTPTPSAPVDIMCNNGALRMVDDELPSGYKRLLGITFDGNLRYETGEALMGSDEVTMMLDNLASNGKNVFGSYNGANDKNFSLYIYGSTNGSYFRYGDQLKRPKYGGTGQRTITFGKSGTSGFAENSTVDPDEFTTPANTYIGMLPNSSSAAFTGDIIGSITVSNRLEWIPCERESDGAIGYYEKFNGNFIAPSGSGTPVSLGYDTSHLTVLSVEGTPEVLSVGAQTASVPMLLSVGDVKDEVELVHGPLARRVTACLYDGTQPVGDVYMSTTGGKDAGAIIVYPLATPTTEQTTAQPLNTNEGTNIVDSVANVSPVELEVTYKKSRH